MAKRPLFFDKASNSQFTLARPQDSTLNRAKRSAPESNRLIPDRVDSPVTMPTWQRSIVTIALQHHSNYI